MIMKYNKGSLCEINLSCDPDPCQNNGKCLVVNGERKCFCFGNFQPPFCT